VRELVGGGELEGRSLWGVARSLLNQQEQQRFLLLTHVTTDLGRSRAWIRSAPLNITIYNPDSETQTAPFLQKKHYLKSALIFF
jgi:hypothetical protein